MGRRSPAFKWITETGGRSPVEETHNSKFTYYSQFFSGKTLPRRIGPGLMPMGIFSILTILGDNDTWSITLYAPAGNQALRALRDPATFRRVVAACPMQAHWLDGTPITPILPMAGIGDRHRRFVIDGEPVVTGFVALGDAAICTNPAAGRGVSLGLLHAQVLRKAVRAHIGDFSTFATAYDAETERQVTPFSRNQLAADRIRIAEMNAHFDGTSPPAPHPDLSRFFAAARQDADVFRAMLESYMCLTPLDEAMARPHVATKMAEFKGPVPPPPVPIDRERLFGLPAA
jgi:2-polyprenyl-6-methoxyphenol hydroxylase-like FAD-dependent oxidoreductase